MLTLYLKQAWELLRQNRLFSTIYIVGTGLAIAMTMVVSVVYYVKLAPVYPEVNRGRTFYLTSAQFEQRAGGSNGQTGMSSWSYGYSYRALQEWFYPLRHAEAVSASSYSGLGRTFVQMADGSGDISVNVRLTDPAFFRVYAFRFTEGSAFTEADLQSGIPVAVLTSDLARRIFGTADGVVGRSFRLNFHEYRVKGVVRAASQLTPQSFADLYLPYSIAPAYREASYPEVPYCGPYHLTLVARDTPGAADSLQAEVRDIFRRYNLEHEAENLKLLTGEQPLSHTSRTLMSAAGSQGDKWQTIRHFFIVLLVLLLVPALNLSGLIASRMESRLPEMGVRKTFGAGRSVLLHQVMWENLLLTLMGGCLGLVLAWTCLYLGRGWVFMLLDSYARTVDTATTYVSGEMLFAPLVFLMALLLCLVLNLLSALLPAWLSLRQPIVRSLFEKR